MPDEKVIIGESLEDLLHSPSDKELQGAEKRKKSVVEKIPDNFFPLKTIPITALALEKMFIMAQEVFSVTNNHVEVYSLSVGSNHIIEDILIPAQDVNHASVHVDTKSLLEVMPIIRSKQLTILGWNHSHASFSVFFSGTDYNNQDIILNDTANYRQWHSMKVKYAYGMTVNVNREYYGLVSTQIFTGKVFHEEAYFKVVNPLPENWDDTDLRKEMVQALSKKVTYRGNAINFGK